MNILMIGDIVGKPGRTIIRELLHEIKQRLEVDFVIANAENAAGGNGITKKVFNELVDAGVEFFTMGNHVWDKKEIYDFIDKENKIIRPANYPVGAPGKGYRVITCSNGEKLGILNLSGRIFLPPLDCPFKTASKLIKEIEQETANIIVDFHAEATSEKVALGWYLDGQVTAVVGTHTHIQTNDARILPQGTAYITDVGMTGPRDSVLGIKKEIVINKFLTQLPARFEVESGSSQLNAVLITIDRNTSKAKNILPIQEFIEN